MKSVRRMVWAVIVIASIFQTACGGGTPTTPTPTPTQPTPTPTPTQPTPTPTSGFSFITLGPEAMGMDVSQLETWGLRGANTDLLVKQMVFGDSSGPVNPGLRELRRLAGSISISVPANLAGKMELFQSDAVVWQELTGLTMTLVSGTGTSKFGVEIGDTGGYTAITRRSFDSSWNVVSATVVFRSLENVTPRTVLHEFGHVLGLNHHTGVGLMGQSPFNPNDVTFAQAEVDNAAMMLRLPSGISFPSSATMSSLTTVSSASRGTMTETVVCRLGR